MTDAENTLKVMRQASKGIEGITETPAPTNVCGRVDSRGEAGITKVVPEERTDAPTYLNTEQTALRVGDLAHWLMIPNATTEL